MNEKDLEGRLAALEYVASISLRTYGLDYAASTWFGDAHQEVLSNVLAKIDAGDIPSPADPRAREAMKEALRLLFKPPSFPPYVGPL